MSFFTMASELTGMVPRMPFDYATSIVNRAALDAYRQNLWSFLTFESNWTSPGWINSGNVTTQQGNNVILFDPVTATPALNAVGMYPSPLTQRQFRTGGVGTIYNIWAYSVPSGTVTTLGTTVTWAAGATFDVFGNQNILNGQPIVINGATYTVAANGIIDPTHLTLTTSAGTQASPVDFSTGAIAILDRAYQEPTVANQGYSIFQCYYVSPVPDFKGWAEIRDMTNYNYLFTNKTRAYFDQRDPQRTFYYIPTHVAFYQNDQNPNSATYGWPMFEMWGAPTYQLTYQLYGYRKGFVLVNGVPAPVSNSSLGSGQPVAMVNPSDDLPTALGEDCVMAKARYYAYEWAEANRIKGERIGNYLQLKKEALVEYSRLYRDYRRDDRATTDAWNTRFRRSRDWPNREPSYNSIAGVASPGV